MSKILPYTLMLAGAAYISLFGVPGLSGKASQESKSNAPVAGEASQSLQDLNLEQILDPQNAYAGQVDSSLYQYFDSIGAPLDISKARVCSGVESFTRMYKENPELQEIVPENVYNTLTDGNKENGEAAGFNLTLDNRLLVWLDSNDTRYAKGEIDGVRQLTRDQAKLLHTIALRYDNQYPDSELGVFTQPPQ